MIVDASAADRSLFDRDFDVCVIGTGPAGMSVARKVAAAGYSVALMEGGDMFLTHESQSLYEGELSGLEYDPLDIPRLRVYGGSSNHWAGKCRAFDAANFEPNDVEPLSGWPLSKADLDAYNEETNAFLDLPAAEEHPDLPVEQEEERFRRIQFRYCDPPTRVGEKYQAELEAAGNVVCAVNANLVDMRLGPDNATLQAALFRTYAPDDPGFEIRARSYCLCLGGLENPRMLLNFDRQMPNGLGNGNDLVGRYFSEHPHFKLGQLYLERPLSEATLRARPEEIYTPTQAFLDRHGILPLSLGVEYVIEPHLTFGTELARSVGCVTSFTERLAERVFNHPWRCERGGLNQYFAQEGDGDVAVQAWINTAAEQSLVRDSRVMLNDNRDALDQRRINLDWRIADVDYRTMETAVLELGAHFAEQGIGRVKLHDWLLADPLTLPGPDEGHRVGGHHHLCTTRMSDDPTMGVVNRNCRMHEVSNLYIGGSSVFATGGYVNPTYTIVQLAHRLGDHLNSVLSS